MFHLRACIAHAAYTPPDGLFKVMTKRNGNRGRRIPPRIDLGTRRLCAEIPGEVLQLRLRAPLGLFVHPAFFSDQVFECDDRNEQRDTRTLAWGYFFTRQLQLLLTTGVGTAATTGAGVLATTVAGRCTTTVSFTTDVVGTYSGLFTQPAPA